MYLTKCVNDPPESESGDHPNDSDKPNMHAPHKIHLVGNSRIAVLAKENLIVILDGFRLLIVHFYCFVSGGFVSPTFPKI